MPFTCKYYRIHELKHHKEKKRGTITCINLHLKLEGHQKDWDLRVLEATIKIPV